MVPVRQCIPALTAGLVDFDEVFGGIEVAQRAKHRTMRAPSTIRCGSADSTSARDTHRRGIHPLDHLELNVPFSC